MLTSFKHQIRKFLYYTGLKKRPYGFHSYTIPAYKFSMDDIKDTFCMGIPDGKGNIEYMFGRIEDGKTVYTHTEITKDPLYEMTKNAKPLPIYKYRPEGWTGGYEEFKIIPPKTDNNEMDKG